MFGKSQTTATQWETIKKDPDLLLNFRITSNRSIITLELKFHLGNYANFSVSDTNSLWIKLLTGTTIKLKSKTNETAIKGGGSIHSAGITVPGVFVKYEVQTEYADTLANQFIEKLRLFTSSGYTDIKIGDWAASQICYGFRDIVFELHNQKKESHSGDGKW